MSTPSRTSSMDTLSSDSSPSLLTKQSIDDSEMSFEDMLKDLQEKPLKNESSNKLTSPRPASENSPLSATTPTKSQQQQAELSANDDEELSFEDILKELADRKEREREAKRQQDAVAAAQKKTLTKSRSTFVLPVKFPSLLRPKSSSNIRVPPAAATKKAETQQPTKPVQQEQATPKTTPTSSKNVSPAQTPISSPTMPSTPTMQPISLNQKSKSESNIPTNALTLLQQEKRPSSFQTNPTEVVEKGQVTLFPDDDDDDGVSFEDFLKELAVKKENSPATPVNKSSIKAASTPAKQEVNNNSKSNSIPTLSLRDVLTSEKYRKYFKMHIEKERSVENIMFYEDVEKYKALKLKLRQKKAKEIIEKYLLPDSLQGININRVLANNILRRIEYEGAVADLFDPIVLELEATVLSDSYWRFQPSKLYLEAIKAKQ